MTMKAYNYLQCGPSCVYTHTQPFGGWMPAFPCFWHPNNSWLGWFPWYQLPSIFCFRHFRPEFWSATKGRLKFPFPEPRCRWGLWGPSWRSVGAQSPLVGAWYHDPLVGHHMPLLKWSFLGVSRMPGPFFVVGRYQIGYSINSNPTI